MASAKALFDQIRAKGRDISFAHGGIGGGGHLCGILIARHLGTTLTYVPYKGAAPALAAVISGEADIMCAQTTDVLPHIASGAVKVFATTGAARSPQLNDVATLEELGMKHAHITQWHAIAAPKGTPPDVIAALNASVRQALANADLKQRLESVGTSVFAGEELTPEFLAHKLQSEVAHWSAVAKQAGISPQ